MVPGVTIAQLCAQPDLCWSPDRQFVRNGNGLALIHQFGEVVFHRMVGIPAIGIGSPAEAPRLVSEIPAVATRVLRRHKTVHKNHPSVKQQDLGMLGFQLEILLHHGVWASKFSIALMGLCPVP